MNGYHDKSSSARSESILNDSDDGDECPCMDNEELKLIRMQQELEKLSLQHLAMLVNEADDPDSEDQRVSNSEVSVGLNRTSRLRQSRKRRKRKSPVNPILVSVQFREMLSNLDKELNSDNDDGVDAEEKDLKGSPIPIPSYSSRENLHSNDGAENSSHGLTYIDCLLFDEERRKRRDPKASQQKRHTPNKNAHNLQIARTSSRVSSAAVKQEPMIGESRQEHRAEDTSNGDAGSGYWEDKSSTPVATGTDSAIGSEAGSSDGVMTQVGEDYDVWQSSVLRKHLGSGRLTTWADIREIRNTPASVTIPHDYNSSLDNHEGHQATFNIGRRSRSGPGLIHRKKNPIVTSMRTSSNARGQKMSNWAMSTSQCYNDIKREQIDRKRANNTMPVALGNWTAAPKRMGAVKQSAPVVRATDGRDNRNRVPRNHGNDASYNRAKTYGGRVAEWAITLNCESKVHNIDDKRYDIPTPNLSEDEAGSNEDNTRGAEVEL